MSKIPAPDTLPSMTAQERHQLLKLARASIVHGLGQPRFIAPNRNHYPKKFQQPGCCFVTLEHQGQLRGCTGSLRPHQPLLDDIAEHAFNAAYCDERFAPMSLAEIDELDLEVALVSPAEPVACDDLDSALAIIRPNIDGLALACDERRAIFLPSVWQQLPNPRLFLEQLAAQAGLSLNDWQPSWQLWRFQSIDIH